MSRTSALALALLLAPAVAAAQSAAGNATPMSARAAAPAASPVVVAPGTQSIGGSTPASPSGAASSPVGVMATSPAANSLSLQGQAALPAPTTLVGDLPGPQTNLSFVSPAQTRVLPPNLNQPPELNIVNPSSLASLATPDDIANAQVALTALGLYRGPVNGLLTGSTRAALASFQSQVAIPMTGTLDTNTADRLGLGRSLAGSQQTQAIADFQLQNGLPVTGVLDDATQQALGAGAVVTQDGIPQAQFRSTVGPVVLP